MEACRLILIKSLGQCTFAAGADKAKPAVRGEDRGLQNVTPLGGTGGGATRGIQPNTVPLKLANCYSKAFPVS